MAADINPSKVSLRYATTQVGWDAGTLVGTTTLVANTWYHVAATFDGRQWTLYLNGNFENSTTIATSTLVSGTGDLNIGAYASGSYHFNGAIDDVRIYNRALSAAEIKNLYQSKLFNRYFTIQNVCRKIGETNIVPASSTSCAGDYFEDPSTQQASIFVEWPAVGNVGQLKLVEYITRWRNEILHEQNWNGGGDQEGPITVPNGKFATSSNIDIDSYGVIKVRPQ